MVQQIQAVLENAVILGATPPASPSLADFRSFSSLRVSLHGRIKPVFGRADFIYQLTLCFPEVAALIDENDFGVLPLEIGAMAAASGEAIARLDFHAVRRHFLFIGKLAERADEGLLDAIQISYLESLLLGETSTAHAEARYLLPKTLGELLRKSERHFERLTCFA